MKATKKALEDAEQTARMRHTFRTRVANFIKHLRETGAFDKPPRLTMGQRQEIIARRQIK